MKKPVRLLVPAERVSHALAGFRSHLPDMGEASSARKLIIKSAQSGHYPRGTGWSNAGSGIEN
jgi:hypothetical protein